MIQVYNNKSVCCGCGLCETVCPRNAIEMQMDEIGFKYPKINQEKCIDCGACKKICGYNTDSTNFIKNSYAAVNTNDKVLQKSASGGIFSAIAQSFLKTQGLVCGAEMLICGNRTEVKHVLIESESELERLQGSKYVQSDIKDCFEEIILRLKEGKKVLFSGTPCQVAAIKRCTRGKFEENLFMIDIICHGVPSLKFFNDYLQVEKTKKKMDIQKFIFRDKKYGWGKKGSICGIKKGNTVTELVNSRTSSYYSLFNDGEVFRDCCYKCPFASVHREGDITIGDYWGILQENKRTNDNLGISQIMLNTQKGERIFDEIKQELEYFEIKSDNYIQPNMRKPTERSMVADAFWKVYNKKGIQSGKNFLKTLKYRMIPYRILNKFFMRGNKHE